MGRLLPFLLLIALISGTAAADSFYLAVDVTSDLGGANFTPWNVARNDSSTYSLELSLPDGTPVNGLHRMDGGDWLLSLAQPADLGGLTFMSNDVVRYDPINGSYSVYLDGEALGIPAASRIDAVFLEGGDNGTLVISFDVRTELGSDIFLPGDLAEYSAGGFSVVLNGLASGLPASANLSGADKHGGAFLLLFDASVTLGGNSYLPGDIVRWDGSSFSLFAADPNWPSGSRARAFCMLASPGDVLPGLTMTKVTGSPKLQLTWQPSCSTAAEDYGIYEGTVGAWTSHTAIDCFDDLNDLTEIIAPQPGSNSYLVVPYSVNAEGFYGATRGVGIRTRGLTVCVTEQDLTPCP